MMLKVNQKKNSSLLKSIIFVVLIIILLTGCKNSKISMQDLKVRFDKILDKMDSKKDLNYYVKKYHLNDYSISELEYLYTLIDHPLSDELVALLQNLIKDKLDEQNIKLTINGQYHKSASVFFCYNMPEDFQARGHVASATGHYDSVDTLAGRNSTIEFSDQDRIELKLSDKYKNAVDEIFVSSPLKMNEFDEQNTEKIGVSNGELDFDSVDTDNEQIMFTIVKGKNDYLYKKVVWVIKKES